MTKCSMCVRVLWGLCWWVFVVLACISLSHTPYMSKQKPGSKEEKKPNEQSWVYPANSQPARARKNHITNPSIQSVGTPYMWVCSPSSSSTGGSSSNRPCPVLYFCCACVACVYCHLYTEHARNSVSPELKRKTKHHEAKSSIRTDLRDHLPPRPPRDSSDFAGPLGPEFEKLADDAADLVLKGAVAEAEDLLGEGGIDGQVDGFDVAVADEQTGLDGGGEVALGQVLGVVPAGGLAEDVALAAGDVGQEGEDVGAGDVVDVHGGAGVGAEALAQQHGEHDGDGAVLGLGGRGGGVIAAQHEGRVQVHDVGGGPHVLDPGLGVGQGGGLGGGVSGELGLERLAGQRDAVGRAHRPHPA